MRWAGNDPRVLNCLWALLLVLGAFACQSTNAASPACTLGDSRECTGADECRGHQMCGGSPRRWYECQCLPIQDGPPTIGMACGSDADCANSELCLDGAGEAFLGGIPAAGVCVLSCTTDPGVCDSLSRPAVCVVTDDRGTVDPADDDAHCFERCQLGGPNAIAKCGGQELVACNLLKGQAAGSLHRPSFRTSTTAADAGGDPPPDLAFCRPLCAADADCSDGLRCDLAAGVCKQAPAPGDPLGSACDPMAMDTTCVGACVTVDSLSQCSHRCKFGSIDNCGVPLDPDASSPDSGRTSNPGLCRFPEDHGAIADTGFCAELCNCDTDCTHPDALCDAFQDRELEALTQRLGVCLAGLDTAGVPRPGLSCQQDL